MSQSRPVPPNSQNNISMESKIGLMRKADVAELCSVSPRTIDQWVKEKKIPFVKIGRNVRFRWRAVEAAILSFEHQAISLQ
jgi:excisionase family DNA binding protein